MNQLKNTQGAPRAKTLAKTFPTLPRELLSKMWKNALSGDVTISLTNILDPHPDSDHH